MAVYTGLCKNCYWSYHTGHSSEEDWNRFLATAGEAVNERGVAAMLTVTFESTPPTAEQRRQLATQISSGASPQRHALVTRSPLIRGVLTALSWMLTRSYDEKVFADPLIAADWVCAVSDCPASAVLSAIRAAVPASELEPRIRQYGVG